jgi:SAM-dependent methyltransferase
VIPVADQTFGRAWVVASGERAGRSGRPLVADIRLRGPAEHDNGENVPVDYFDSWIAQHYMVLWPHLFDPQVVEPTVSFLADLAGHGRALELGIGTGRLALPLVRRGVDVVGIELSEAMVEQLRAQPDSADIEVRIGDFSTTTVDGTFAVVYLVRNTIMNLTTQHEQVECFRNVARHLEPGGSFVIEVIVPPWQRLPPGETLIPFDVSPAHVGFDEIDVATQNSWSHHHWFVDGETTSFSAPFRYVWPSELDLMARIAGMVLHDRWSDWDRQPFTSTSRSHVSVWKKPEQKA